MRRDNCFDFLRFAFAFNVVLGHLTVIALYPTLNAYSYLFNTYLSVTGFFVISGFLIAQSYEHSTTVKSYFIKRAKRLLPAYLFVVIACAIGLVTISELSASEYFRSPDFWKYLGANVCFLNFAHPSLPGVFNSVFINDNSVNPAMWTLKIEVGFYLIIPLLFYLFRKCKKPWILLIIIYWLAVLYRNGLHHYAGYTQSPLPVFLARQLPGFMSYFTIGIAAYLYKEKWMQYKNALILPAIILYGIEYWLNIEYLTPLAWGIIVLWLAFSIPSLNNFAKYGDISYGIYIYHSPILKTLLTLGLFSQIGVWPATLVYIIIVIVVGFCSWHLLENQFLKRR